uniref:Fibronectin type-III domain-containing protein n=1 Tax=Romanomermis culicivorax TaxID=13658 RepID=A0A915IQI3_ROMCU
RELRKLGFKCLKPTRVEWNTRKPVCDAAQCLIRIEKTSRDANFDVSSVASAVEISASSITSISDKINNLEVTSDQISNSTPSIINEENSAPPLFRLNDDAKLNFADLKRLSLVRPLFPPRNSTSSFRYVEERTSSAITTKFVAEDDTRSTMFFMNENITITPLLLTSTEISGDKLHDREQFTFEVERRPNGTLLISSPAFETHGNIYKISLSSLDDPSSSTVNINITQNPFEIQNLTPSREYMLKFYIFDENDGEKFINSTRITIEPSRPKINRNFVNATTNSFNFALEYERISNHNLFYYSITNVDEEANVRHENFTIDHSFKKRLINYSINNLKSGHIYNVSIKPFYNNVAGPALNLTYVTKPLPPTNVSMSNNDPDFVLVQWSAPENSGLDGYRVEITAGNAFM